MWHCLKNVYNEHQMIRKDKHQGDKDHGQCKIFSHSCMIKVCSIARHPLIPWWRYSFLILSWCKIRCVFSHVFIIDTTYKTNRYNLSFVYIVSVASTNNIFGVTFTFTTIEIGDNFIWVSTTLWVTLDKCT